MDALKQLKKELKTVVDLYGVVNLMHWDMETYMPKGSGSARAAQIALLTSIAHERFIGDGIKGPLGELINLDSGVIKNGIDSESKKLVTEIWKDFHRAAALPKEFVKEMSGAASLGQQAWIEARKKNDWNQFAPHLENIITLKQREIQYIGTKTTPYDTLLDAFEPEMTTADVNELFNSMKSDLITMVQKISKSGVDTHEHILFQHYDVNKQWSFTEQVLRDMGFDFNCGRQDKSTHPFTINFHPTDVRITTRVDENNFMYCLSSSIHEGGHALYEQGMDPRWYGTPFCEAISYGIHESQSRLWENLVGLSKPFWEYYFPKLQKIFPENLSLISADEFYLAVNTIKPGLIRTEADEITYNLHIMLRFEIEQLIINEGLEVNELPVLWNKKMEEYFDIIPETDTNGVLQDVHWSQGSFGYFPTYALGNLYNIIMYTKANEDLPNMKNDIREGNFLFLRNWLKDNIHEVGRRQTAKEIIKTISGKNLSAKPFIDYLKNKYSEIYTL